MVVNPHSRPGQGAGLIGDEFGKGARVENTVESLTGLRLTPADKVAIAYLAIITFPILFSAKRIELWWVFCICHALLIGLILLIARALPISRFPGLPSSASRSSSLSTLLPFLGSFIRGWYPVLIIPITYKELTYLIPLIHPTDFDATLAAVDFRVLGVHPTIWLERFTWPPLTEVLQLTYSCYYFLPIVLGVVLWRRRTPEFYFWVFVVVLGFYVSYLGYISVPAIGPRFLPEIAEAQTIPLSGIWLFASVREVLDRAEGITRDCFPSGHTELTLLVLYYARAFHKKVFWWLFPIGTGIIISTMYLRYHYLIDVVAGALLAVVIILFAKPLYRVLGSRVESL
jgi:membrane-associated phospholipid phosphatase